MSLPKLSLVALLAAAVTGFRLWTPTAAAYLKMRVEPAEISADGYQQAALIIESPAAPKVSVVQTPRRVTLGQLQHPAPGQWRMAIRAGVQPGSVTLRAEAGITATATLHLRSDLQDRERDGMPDALQLDTPEDRAAFRRWFAFLAEIQFFQETARLPVEINDCAALIRYAYREALRPHDSRWSAEAQLPLVVPLDPIAKVQYPHTMLNASLFRVRPGPLRASDLADGSFSQFADAKTLQARNAHFISRDLARAQPGDLLFFRHDAAGMPFHGMVYLGRSQVRDDGKRYLLYHTGPDGSDPGEIRRPTVEQLSAHPNPGWRPLAGNPTFLGVYRWNILR